MTSDWLSLVSVALEVLCALPIVAELFLAVAGLVAIIAGYEPADWFW